MGLIQLKMLHPPAETNSGTVPGFCFRTAKTGGQAEHFASVVGEHLLLQPEPALMCQAAEVKHLQEIADLGRTMPEKSFLITAAPDPQLILSALR